MSTRTLVTITDDLTGAEGATPVGFSLDGASMVIDLAPDNEQALRSALAPFIAVARRMPANGKHPNGKHRRTQRPATVPAGAPSPSQPASAPEPASEPTEPAEPVNGTPPDLASVDNALVRAWCRQRGIDVNERGRVPLALKSRYLTAMGANGGDAQP